jgi:hypothetical protein
MYRPGSFAIPAPQSPGAGYNAPRPRNEGKLFREHARRARIRRRVGRLAQRAAKVHARATRRAFRVGFGVSRRNGRVASISWRYDSDI